MKRYTFNLVSIIVLVLGLYFEPIAQALPAGQRDCDTGQVLNDSFTGSTLFEIVPNSSVTVNNGTVSRNCIIQFSTEVFTSPDDVTALRYTIDSNNPANCVAIGPELFHVNTGQGTFETVTHMGVKNIGAGSHTIRPCYQAQDGNLNSFSASIFTRRCLTVECRTQ